MKLPSPNQSRVFTRERDKTLKRVCVIKFNPWSFSGYVSPLCIASCSLHSLCEMFLDAARVCNDILTIWLPLPVNKQSPRSPPFPERHTYSRGVFWSASSLFFFFLRVTSNQRCCQGNFMRASGTSIQHRWNCEVTCRHTLHSRGSVTTSRNTKLSYLQSFFPLWSHCKLHKSHPTSLFLLCVT